MKSCLTACLLAALVPGAAWAQEAPAEAERAALQRFEPAYFERFAPQTALDMVRRIPGFSIRNNNEGRGLGQGGTNVLINGERVTSKESNVVEILERTPAATVVVIEVADAATLGVTGLTGQVANVIIDRSNLSGSYEYSMEFRDETKPRFKRGQVSISGETGKLSYTLGLASRSRRGFERGLEEVLDSLGGLTELRDEHVQIKYDGPRLTYDLGYEFSAKTKLRLTGSGELGNFQELERSESSNGSFRTAENAEDEWNTDITAELSHDIGPGTAKLISYTRLEHSPVFSRTKLRTPGEEDFIQTFEQVADEGESIGRAEYAWGTESGVSWEFAGEAAFNFVDVESDFLIQDGLDNEEVAIPGVRVEELRAQTSLTRGFQLFETVNVQASLAGEWSRLTVESEGGDEPREESFLRPKGFVSLAFPLGERLDLRARVDRSVGQLNFFDFVSSVNLTDEREDAGNKNLVPQQSWDSELELQRDFGNDERIVLRFNHSFIADRVDNVLVTVERDGELVRQNATGNIPKARFAAARLEGTVLTDRWGLKGGRFDIEGARFYSEVEDQLTGENRSFNGFNDWFYRIDFRHDIPGTNWAWGGDIRRRGPEEFIRFDEETRFSLSRPFYGAGVEYKDFYGALLRLRVGNIANTDFKVNRVRYDGFRDGGVIDEIERRERYDNQRWAIDIVGTF